MSPDHQNGAVVLLVDDTPANLAVLYDALQGEGLRVLVANDGESALHRAEYARPDLILLDVMMPGISGFETCRRLKANPETAAIPVIFMTALSDPSDKVEGFRSGGVDYVTKPIHVDEVVARVRTHLTLRRLRRDLEERNAQLRDELQQKAELIDDLDAFTHTVAHDIRSPLTPIVSYASMLLESFDTLPQTERREFLEIIERRALQIAEIVEALLLLAGVSRQNVARTPFDPRAVVASVRERLREDIAERAATVYVADDLPVAIGYAPWVAEVFANLMSNALKYGGRPPTVTVGGVDEGNGRCRFYVRDNGAGLSSEQQAALFRPFSRTEEAQSSGEPGHGLGLSIVARIVQKLGGEIGVRSAGVAGRGCEFYFTLPAPPGWPEDRAAEEG